MSPEPVPADPGRDGDPAWFRPDPMPAAEWEAWLDHPAAGDEPAGEGWLDPEDGVPLPGEDVLTPEELAEVLGRAGRLMPGGLRAAIARAVMEVAPAGQDGRPGGYGTWRLTTPETART